MRAHRSAAKRMELQFVHVPETAPSRILPPRPGTLRIVLIVPPLPQRAKGVTGPTVSASPWPAPDKIIGRRRFPDAMPRSLAGHVALVTGSTGQGMGRSTALTLAREDADVVLNYGTNRATTGAAHRRLLEAIESFDVRGIVVRADTADGDEVRALFVRAREELRPVDILVNNAGGVWDPTKRDLAKIADRFWQGVLRAEIDGMFHTLKAALPEMRRRRWGRIVNVGMERSEEFMEPPYDYTVGKIARHALTRILSEVEIPRGVTINAVAPGYIPYFTFRQALDAVRHRGPWPRRKYGTPQDVAELVAFLCTDAARNVTGAVIPIHGAPY